MHDRHGNPLAEGDEVIIRGKITTCHNAESEYCNVTITTDVPMAGNPFVVTLNAKQVELAVVTDSRIPPTFVCEGCGEQHPYAPGEKDGWRTWYKTPCPKVAAPEIEPAGDVAVS